VGGRDHASDKRIGVELPVLGENAGDALRHPFRYAPCARPTTRARPYDHDQQLLTFLLVCRVCGTEELMHRQPYEPRFEPIPPRFRRMGDRLGRSAAAGCFRSGRDQVRLGAR
jgi:hypothetical protein